MEIKKAQVPIYQLTLTAEEMAELWGVLYKASSEGVEGARCYFNKLEDVRPAGGFCESR